jgi:hypothetical protein
MSRFSQEVFTHSTQRVRNPVSRRRTHRLLRLGLVCGGFVLAAAGLLVLAFRT